MALRYDASPLGKVERTPQGGIRVPATLSRTGVQAYTQPDGSVRREYRPAEEVFAASALDTLRGAPVTNLHPGNGRVDAADWRRKAVGHAGEDVRQEGIHVAATLYIQDADTIALIEGGSRSEVSVGYDVGRLDMSPGVSPEGEPYDAIQRQITCNHVALVPRGRAGRTVGLRLDADDNQIPEESPSVQKIKIAGKEYTVGTPECDAALAAMQTRLDAAEAQATALRVERVKDTALAVGVRTDAATEADVMLEVLKKLAPGVKVEGQSPDFIMGAFLCAVSLKLEEDASAGDEPAAEEKPEPQAPPGPSAAQVRADAEEARRKRASTKRQDAESEGLSLAEEARQRMIERGKSGRQV